MIAARLIRSGVVAAAIAAGVATLGAGAASAAEAPRWKVTAITTPTSVVAGTPRDEVQQVSVDATGGTFKLLVRPWSYGGTKTPTAALPYDATAAEVQAALEAISGINSGGVSVTGGPGGSAAYEVSFTGRNANDPIEPMGADSGELTGGTHSVAVTQLTKGEPSPQLIMTATNVGGAATDGTTISVEGALPRGVTATKVTGYDLYASYAGFAGKGAGGALACTAPPAVSCADERTVDPGDQLIITATLEVAKSGVGPDTTVTVKGGGATEETTHAPFSMGSTPAPYGPAPGSVVAALSTQQAGAHPNITTQFALSTSDENVPSADERDIRFDLPPGLVGSTVGMARCSMTTIIEEARARGVCPRGAMVGVATVDFVMLRETESGEVLPSSGGQTIAVPVYNIAPSPGEPAAFGFDAFILPVRLDTTVLSNGDYGVRVTAPELPETAQTLYSSITIWGVPALHNGPGPDKSFLALMGAHNSTFGGPSEGAAQVPLMTSPQQCQAPLTATMETDSWTKRGEFASESASAGMLTGCNKVPFSSSFSFLPDTLEAGAPAGYTFTLNVPQQNTAETLATSSVKDVKLALPEGVVVNPSAAWGLKACSSVEFYGPDHPSQGPASLAQCPREAQVGEVEVESPDLEHPLKGQVFLGTPECDPCTPEDAQVGKMVRLFIQLVGEGEAGIIVKLEGHGDVNQSTGQITTVFSETPQVPFNRMRFVLEGGPRAVLANPRRCGVVKSTGDLTPWTTEPGISDSMPFYEFEITQNCFGPQFSPSFQAGMPNIQAGEFGEFTLAFGRPDNSEMLKSITTHMPPGLMGSLDGIPFCKEPQASAGECSASSQIGEAEVLTGPGADPFLVKGGQVYLTEGYGGAPYGLSIVVPAVAGPYTLSGTTGKGTVVVRAQIFVNEHTAQLTVVSGEMPSMLDGIPLQLKAVNVRINRPNFMFNPTSCNKMAITGTLTAVEGMSANVESPFQVTNCLRLPFTPKFTASTHAHHTRKEGAYLHVVMKASRGQANIRSVHVELPTALPSELPTLQKACTEAQFAANPAGCPPESIVGHATIQTPLVPVPVQGPAYFVSHGGAEFPELVMVLQGYGITVILNGETFIAKSEVTSSTFKTVPDVPFSRFDLVLPTGAHPALAGNGNFCAENLIMPTRIVAQSGKVIEQRTKIAVEGCTPEIHVRKHTVHGATARLIVQVPSAGNLIANGNGIGRALRKSKHAGRVAITVRLTKHVRRMLDHHHHRKLRVEVRLRFKAKHGKTLSSHVGLLMR